MRLVPRHSDFDWLNRGVQSHMRGWIGFLIPPPKGEGGIGGLRPPFLAPRTPTRSVGSASVARRVGWGFLLIARHSKLDPPPGLAALGHPPRYAGRDWRSKANGHRSSDMARLGRPCNPAGVGRAPRERAAAPC